MPPRTKPLLTSLLALVVLALAVLPAQAAAQLFEPEGSFGSGAASDGRFADAAGIATDAAGRVYVADSAAGRVEVFDNAAGGNAFIRSVGEGVLQKPVGVAIDARNRIFVADAARSVVVLFAGINDDAAVRREYGSPGTGFGQLAQPRFIALDPGPQVYVSERETQRVSSFRTGAQPIAAVSLLNPPTFLEVEGLERDRDALLYVSEQSADDGEVRVYREDGTHVGTPAGPGAADGQVNAPRGLTLDPANRLIVADTGNDRIQLFAPFAAGVSDFAGSYAGAVGDAFDAPADTALAPGALLYVSDTGNGRVVRLRFDDADRDGAIEAVDNCPGEPNRDQRNTDRNGRGDACDPDDDDDGIADGDDRCPLTRRGPDLNKDGCGDPRSRVLVPSRSSYRSRRPSRVAGTASADELGVGRVEFALARAVGGGCAWYLGGGRFGSRGPCDQPVWLPAAGTERWSARVSIRGRGKYRALSRAHQRGNDQVESLRGSFNTRAFRLR